jgi:hypothetical protein
LNSFDNVREILEDLNTERQKVQLLDFPDQIYRQKEKIRSLRQVFKDADSERALREADIASEIASETNPDTGKPVYSNAAARDDERLKRLARDPEYQQLLKKVREASMAVESAQDELERIENKFKASRYVTALITEEISLYAGELSINAMEERAQMITSNVKQLKKAQAY